MNSSALFERATLLLIAFLLLIANIGQSSAAADPAGCRACGCCSSSTK